jgi:hypothetical protein
LPPPPPPLRRLILDFGDPFWRQVMAILCCVAQKAASAAQDPLIRLHDSF